MIVMFLMLNKINKSFCLLCIAGWANPVGPSSTGAESSPRSWGMMNCCSLRSKEPVRQPVEREDRATQTNISGAITQSHEQIGFSSLPEGWKSQLSPYLSIAGCALGNSNKEQSEVFNAGLAKSVSEQLVMDVLSTQRYINRKALAPGVSDKDYFDMMVILGTAHTTSLNLLQELRSILLDPNTRFYEDTSTNTFNVKNEIASALLCLQYAQEPFMQTKKIKCEPTWLEISTNAYQVCLGLSSSNQGITWRNREINKVVTFYKDNGSYVLSFSHGEGTPNLDALRFEARPNLAQSTPTLAPGKLKSLNEVIKKLPESTVRY